MAVSKVALVATLLLVSLLSFGLSAHGAPITVLVGNAVETYKHLNWSTTTFDMGVFGRPDTPLVFNNLKVHVVSHDPTLPVPGCKGPKDPLQTFPAAGADVTITPFQKVRAVKLFFTAPKATKNDYIKVDVSYDSEDEFTSTFSVPTSALSLCARETIVIVSTKVNIREVLVFSTATENFVGELSIVTGVVPPNYVDISIGNSINQLASVPWLRQTSGLVSNAPTTFAGKARALISSYLKATPVAVCNPIQTLWQMGEVSIRILPVTELRAVKFFIRAPVAAPNAIVHVWVGLKGVEESFYGGSVAFPQGQVLRCQNATVTVVARKGLAIEYIGVQSDHTKLVVFGNVSVSPYVAA